MKNEIRKIIPTLKAVVPLVWNAARSGQLFNPQAELIEPV
jgi:hypothetical protein